MEPLEPQIVQIHDLIHSRRGAGHEYSGWVDWPLNYNGEEFCRIKTAAEKIRKLSDVFIVIGIGGSYLGARSALELLQHSFYNQLPANKRGGPEVYFAGFNISPAYLRHLLDLVAEKELAVNIISKSGTTLERRSLSDLSAPPGKPLRKKGLQRDYCHNRSGQRCPEKTG